MEPLYWLHMLFVFALVASPILMLFGLCALLAWIEKRWP